VEVTRVPIDVSAAERARWLAELSEALEQAERLVWSLGDRPGVAPELKELYGRLDAARAEVQSLRFRRAATGRSNNPPFWTELQPWNRAIDSPKR
jgi:hypothetical protein